MPFRLAPLRCLHGGLAQYCPSRSEMGTACAGHFTHGKATLPGQIQRLRTKKLFGIAALLVAVQANGASYDRVAA